MKLTVGGRAKSDGFALPTILLVSTVMLIVLVASVAATAASRVSLDSQYYNQLAQQAAQSGMARVKECLEGSGYSPQWSTSATNKDLRPDSSCTGQTLTGPNTSAYVVGNAGSNPSALRTRYTVEAQSGAGIGTVLRIVGVTELVRTSSPNNVWRHYEQSLFYRIEPVEAIACPDGFVAVPGDTRFGTDDFCVGKYESKNVNGRAVSQADGLPYNISQDAAKVASEEACQGCHLITEGEWLTMAHNVANVNSNWSGGAVGSGYLNTGHNDNDPTGAQVAGPDSNGYLNTNNTSPSNQRRTWVLSNGEVVWDIGGNHYEWTSGQVSTNKPGAAGLTWRDWNSLGGPGSMSPNPLPSFGTSAASGWTNASHGVGRLYSDTADVALRGVLRSGNSNNASTAGIFAVALHASPAAASGFRMAYAPPRSDETVFVFDTTAPGCTGTVQLPISSPASGGTIDWGNGDFQPRTSALQAYTYPTPGVYTVKFKGSFTQASYYSTVNATNAKCLTKVEQWAASSPINRVSFYNASNLTYVAEPPSTVTNMANMFQNAVAFNQPIGSWNTTNVANMSNMFYNADAFNQPIGSWNTTNVTNMVNMFYNAAVFNQPIGGWNTANVTNMGSMFYFAPAFNQPIGGWNTANVTNMSYMFASNPVFNQPIGSWNTAKVTTMRNMFNVASSFNQPIGSWNTALVTSMTYMFHTATAFNQPIGSWTTTNVTDMAFMFQSAVAFNYSISGWNTAKVTNMNSMFREADAFNQPIGAWNTGLVTNMTYMFYGANVFNQPLATWNTANVLTMNWMFSTMSFNQPIGGWVTSKVTDISGMFWNNPAFNQPIGGWNISLVTTLYGTFYNADAFNQPLNTWNTVSVNNMYATFASANIFNQPLNLWKTASVTTMQQMFNGSSAFNQNISAWNVAAVTVWTNFHSVSPLTQANCPPKLW